LPEYFLTKKILSNNSQIGILLRIYKGTLGKDNLRSINFSTPDQLIHPPGGKEKIADKILIVDIHSFVIDNIDVSISCWRWSASPSPKPAYRSQPHTSNWNPCFSPHRFSFLQKDFTKTENNPPNNKYIIKSIY